MLNFKTATKPEMIKYGRDELGIELKLEQTEEEMRQTIVDRCDVLGKMPPQEAVKELRKKGAKQKMVKIKIHKGDKLRGGDRPVPVGLNGTCYTIPRGIAVSVPEGIVDILNHSIETHYEYDETLDDLVPRDIPSYSFSIL